MPREKIQPTLLQIAQLGHPVLRRKAEEVKEVKDKAIQKLIDDLIVTMKEADGVGIAAPQVYSSLRIFIVASWPNTRYPKAPKMKPLAVINPTILEYSKETVTDWEGCLSVPGIRALVPRSKLILVEYLTREGKKVRKKYSELVARIFQHEFDHLEGIIFLDRVKSSKDIVTEKEFLRLMKEQLGRKK